MTARSRSEAVALALAVALLAGCTAPPRRLPPASDTRPAVPLPTIADRVAQYGPSARARLAPHFAAARAAYPPERFAVLAFKRERVLHLFAPGPHGDLVLVRSYPIDGASGVLGPKLRRGDHQVPEGIYRIEYLNPNSVAHLSLALGYPNAWDRARAYEDGRHDLGGDIMIHGGSMSRGCLAVGDSAAEELFVLAADAGFDDAIVVVSPVDFRQHELPVEQRAATPWVGDLYAVLRAELAAYPRERVGTPQADAHR